MPEFHGSATRRVDARPDDVFDLITDIDRLPEWNACIERVVERPTPLDIGAEWVVTMHVPGMPRWNSRSRLIELDRDTGRFAYRTQSDDGNPSFGTWTWERTGTGAAPRSPSAGTSNRRRSGAMCCSPASGMASSTRKCRRR